MPTIKKVTVSRRRPKKAGVNRVTTVVARSTPRPKRKVKRLQQARAPRAHPLTMCVYGPPDQVGTETGVPDGNDHKSIIVEHRGTYTLSPTTDGKINFALVPCPYGTLAIANGGVTATVNTVDTTTVDGDITGLTQYDFAASTGVTNTYTDINGTQRQGDGGPNPVYCVLPFKEHIPSTGHVAKGGVNNSGLTVQQFRVIANVAKVSYVGDDFHNSGAVAICRLPFETQEDITAQPGTVTGVQPFQQPKVAGIVPNDPPINFDDIAIQSGSILIPYRDGANLCNPPNSLNYQQWRNDWMPVHVSGSSDSYVIPFAGIAAADADHAVLCPQPLPGIGTSITYYAATGVQQGQNIVVETRTCVEYTLAFNSPMVRFAKLPPPKHQAAIDQVQQIARTIPAATSNSESWYSKFWNWYWPKEKAAVSTAWTVGGNIASQYFGKGGKYDLNEPKNQQATISTLSNMFGRMRS